jgi:hypothetical protein
MSSHGYIVNTERLSASVICRVITRFPSITFVFFACRRLRSSIAAVTSIISAVMGAVLGIGWWGSGDRDGKRR